MDEKIKKFKGWFTSDLFLTDIGKILKRAGLIKNFEYDYENIYEWFIAYVGGENFRWDFSRKHCEHEGFENEPISFYILYGNEEPPDEVIINMARRLSRLFKCDVAFGHVEYVGGDEFEYRKTGEIKKPQSN